MITFTNVTKRFGNYRAVDNLSLTVPMQQAAALWGPNGAGKTTVIKCLLGLLRYEGQIMVNGYDAYRQGRNARRLVGYVPQELAFYEEMSTLDTVRFFAQLKGAPLTDAVPILTQVGLEEHAGKPVDALSGGMKQRLALGLALLGDPPVLVLSFDPQAALADDPQASAVRELLLTLDVAQTPEAAEPFPAWHRAATLLATEMDATLVDEDGVPITLHLFDGIARQLDELYRELEARDLAAGSTAARRLFS